jgi:hypothetical protein
MEQLRKPHGMEVLQQVQGEGNKNKIKICSRCSVNLAHAKCCCWASGCETGNQQNKMTDSANQASYMKHADYPYFIKAAIFHC